MNKRKWKFNFRGEDDTVIIAMTPDQAVFPSRLTKGSTSATYRQIRRPEPCLTKITPMTVILLNAHKIYIHIFVTFFSVLHQNSAKMHSCTYVISLFFLEKKEWNLNCFHFFREMKSEIIFLFTLFEKWKVNWFLISLFSRSESEIEKPRDRDREVKYEKNSPEFSRNETLAGCWSRVGKTTLFQSSSQNSYIISPKVFICHSGFGTCATGTSPSPYFVT